MTVEMEKFMILIIKVIADFLLSILYYFHAVDVIVGYRIINQSLKGLC